MGSTNRVSFDLETTGGVAQRLCVPLNRVQYAVKRLGLVPAGRAGRLRLFSPVQLEAIRREIERTATVEGGRR
jgi:hypothetical protein